LKKIFPYQKVTGLITVGCGIFSRTQPPMAMLGGRKELPGEREKERKSRKKEERTIDLFCVPRDFL